VHNFLNFYCCKKGGFQSRKSQKLSECTKRDSDQYWKNCNSVNSKLLISSATTRKHTMVGQKYFKGEGDERL